MTQKSPYLVSVIIPVYNAEAWLGETIESVVNQTIGFTDSIELVLINDGSTDNSEDVCLEYVKRYPNNVVYKYQKNTGVSAARNCGIELATSRYITFMDSDDVVSKDAYKRAVELFAQNRTKKISFVSWRLLFFEAKFGAHPLNDKFESDAIFDVSDYPNRIQMHVNSCMFPADIIKKYTFDTSLKYAEDAKLITEILIDNGAYGVLKDPVLFYRKRNSGNSALDTQKINKNWYLPVVNDVYLSLIERSRKIHGNVIDYLQWMLLYDLQWRFRQQKQTILSDKEVKRYVDGLSNVLRAIDVSNITSQKYLDTEYTAYLLQLRSRDTNKAYDATIQDAILTIDGNTVRSYSKEPATLHVSVVDFSDNKLSIEGYGSGIPDGNIQLVFQNTNKKVTAQLGRNIHKQKTFIGFYVSGFTFKVSIPVSNHDSVRASFTLNGSKPQDVQFVFNNLSRLSHLKAAYRHLGNSIIEGKVRSIEVEPHTALAHLRHEIKREVNIVKNLSIKATLSKIKKARSGKIYLKWPHHFSNPTLYFVKFCLVEIAKLSVRLLRNVSDVVVRWFALIYKAQNRNRNIWLISDRPTMADDSGEILFSYINGLKQDAISPYFAYSKTGPEYDRLKAKGKVADFGSLHYKLLFLSARKVISSEATDTITNAFGWRAGNFIDLYDFDFVFLQHGIIKDDISSWLNKYNKNIKLFITSTDRERESIVNGEYGYTNNEVVTTGLARYDLLENNPENKVILMPTWRHNLEIGADPKTGVRYYNENFKHSDYYKFFQGIMDDKRLLDTFRVNDMKGELYLHPSFQAQIRDFIPNEYFDVKELPFDYPQLKRKGSILVTDYSSVAFDFAYLKKPVVYAQFDEKQFYQDHTSKEGYFSYQDDGFGSVVYTADETVDAITKLIEGGSKMDKKYRDRVDTFFKYTDKHNSERIYNAILNMDKTL